MAATSARTAALRSPRTMARMAMPSTAWSKEYNSPSGKRRKARITSCRRRRPSAWPWRGSDEIVNGDGDLLTRRPITKLQSPSIHSTQRAAACRIPRLHERHRRRLYGYRHPRCARQPQHKPKSDRWLKRHPNMRFHFTPRRAFWLNQVEIWFSILEGKSLHGASFTSVRQFRVHIDAFIEAYNETAKPFVWTKAEVHQRRFKGRR